MAVAWPHRLDGFVVHERDNQGVVSVTETFELFFILISEKFVVFLREREREREGRERGGERERGRERVYLIVLRPSQTVELSITKCTKVKY